MYWIGWNDKLLANPTDRKAEVTEVAVHAAIVGIEAQVPSAAMV